ncbi:MAG: hypothetical protein E7244_04195 [Enterocloster citroniae]|nr:hypothetical protein [Enterocloster citroniae]
MHVEKFAKSAVGHMLQHYNRSAVNYGNEAIDCLRSDLNYNLAPKRDVNDFTYYQQRLAQVKCQNRADIKTLCSWIITLPKQDFTEAEEKKFFQTAYNFMAKRYGEKNIISAWVHKDEAGQPHLHFTFIPVAIDKKKGIEKVSAKEVITRNDLRVIHKEMAEHMEQVFGRDIGILNGSTIGGNKTIMELKIKELQEDISTLKMVKGQSVEELATIIKKRPKTLTDITKAVRIAAGDAPPKQVIERNRERSR